MMMRDYRKAELIELHDCGTSVNPRGYADAIAGWTEAESEDAPWRLDGEALSMVFSSLGFKLEPFRREFHRKDGRIRETVSELHHFHSLPIFNRYYKNVGDHDRWIAALEARIIGQELLDMRITWQFAKFVDDIEEPAKETVCVTYRGNFTVWWAQEDEAAEQDAA